VSERSLSAVIACYDAGMKIIVATARPPRAVRWFLPESLLDIASFIYYNGVQVACRHTGAEWHESIPSSVTADIIDYCLELDPNVELTMEARDEWFSLRELDYSATMNARANPVTLTLDVMKQYEATKIPGQSLTKVWLCGGWWGWWGMVASEISGKVQLNGRDLSRKKPFNWLSPSISAPAASFAPARLNLTGQIHLTAPHHAKSYAITGQIHLFANRCEVRRGIRKRLP